MRSALALLLLAWPAMAQPRTVTGEPRWRDGDTVVVSGVPVRLNGLHAPELSEPGGREAKSWMIARTRGQTITCTLDGSRTHDRWAGICRDALGDLAEGLIAAGLGRDCQRYSGGRYKHLERPESVSMPLPAYCYPRPRRPL